jgi:hypothetical protein
MVAWVLCATEEISFHVVPVAYTYRIHVWLAAAMQYVRSYMKLANSLHTSHHHKYHLPLHPLVYAAPAGMDSLFFLLVRVEILRGRRWKKFCALKKVGVLLRLPPTPPFFLLCSAI